MEYFDVYFKINVPYIIILISFAIMCVADVFIMISVKEAKVQRKWVLMTMLLEYIFIVVCSTVLCRASTLDYKYELMPFWSYVEIYNGKMGMLAEILLNILLFIPIGVMLSCWISDMRWLKIMLVALGLSMCIELSQLLLKRGLCEIDDLIHNTCGAMIGGWCAMRFLKLYRK